MKNKFRYVSFLLLLVLLLVPASSVHAQGSGPGDGSGRVIFGSNFTLKSGDTFEGDLVLFGGNVTIEEDATLKGNLVVIGGQVESNGLLDGDLVVVGGQVSLEKTAVVEGDVVTVGGQLQQEDGAEINGEVVNNVAPEIDIPNGRVPPVVPGVPSVPDVPSAPNINIDFNPFLSAGGIFFRAVVVAMLAMLIVVFLQPQMEQVSDAIVSQPLMSGVFGLAATVGGPIVILVASLIMIVTLILIPVAVVVLFLGSLLLALAWLFGVIALGYEVGERFTRSLNQTWAPVLTAGFGTFLVMLVGGAVGAIPCIGWVVPTLIGLVAVGAVAITRFGVRPVPVSVANVYTPPVDQSQIPPTS
ncbi:MAG: polymer-forming cytoskeletal protein [Anaerolineales bacterium]|nr:polymer-forming cytoskeletal protein [Anaerolineales bacterium]